MLAPSAGAVVSQPYNYGVNWYGYSKDERKELNNLGNQITIFSNAQKFFDLINSEGMAVNIASIYCFSTQILQGGVLGNIVTNVRAGQSLLNNDGTFNLEYMAGIGSSYYDCNSFGLSDDNMELLRTYLLDYNLMSAGACFLSVAYPNEEFSYNATTRKTYKDMTNPACSVFL
jgi:hypothetical protein